MTMHALMRHLPYFGPGGIPVPRQEATDASPPPRALVPERPAPPLFNPEEVGHAVAQARREVAAEARSALAARDRAHRDEITRLAAETERRLAAARGTWCDAEADRLAAAVEKAFATLETRIGDALGRLLLPFVAGEVRARAVEEARHAIAALLARPAPRDAAAAVMTVSGPHDLLAALKARLGDPKGIVFRPAGDAEIAITCGDTLIETRLAAWARRLGPQPRPAGDDAHVG